MATKGQREAVWRKAKPIRGKSSNLYRRDSEGKVIFKSSYGKNSPMGWEVDHIYPKSRGGPDRYGNLQALSTRGNRAKGRKLPTKAHKSQYRRKKR